MRSRRSIFDIMREHMEELEEIAEEMFDRFLERPSWDINAHSLEPLFDVSVSSDKVIVTADLPKVDPENIRISRISDDIIEITAKMRVKINFEDLGVTHRKGEFSYFSCRVPLPVPVDTSRAKARFKRGILEITLPRKRGYEIKVE